MSKITAYHAMKNKSIILTLCWIANDYTEGLILLAEKIENEVNQLAPHCFANDESNLHCVNTIQV